METQQESKQFLLRLVEDKQLRQQLTTLNSFQEAAE